MSNSVIRKDGTVYWYSSDGLMHREDGPAVEMFNGEKHWYINGKLHREDGPAIEFPGNIIFIEAAIWYIDDRRIEGFCDQYNIPYTYKDWPLEYKILWKLNYV